MRLIENPRKALWFGTAEYSQWLPTPLSGADMTSSGHQSGGVLLNGGGYEVNSWDSHKVYSFEWPESSSAELVQTLKSYRDGTFGRGLLYFIDPLTFDKNILPARWADPSMALNNEAPSLVLNYQPTPVPTSNFQVNALPVTSAFYDLASVGTGHGQEGTALRIPIPEGFELYLGAVYSSTGTGGVYYSSVTATGAQTGKTRVTPKTPTSRSRVGNVVSRPAGGAVYLYLSRSGAGAGTVTLTALTAIVAPIGYVDTTGLDANLEPTGADYANGRTQRFLSGKWIGGMGNSGVRFSGTPTHINMSGFDGGRISTAASFREVGSWAFG